MRRSALRLFASTSALAAQDYGIWIDKRLACLDTSLRPFDCLQGRHSGQALREINFGKSGKNAHLAVLKQQLTDHPHFPLSYK